MIEVLTTMQSDGFQTCASACFTSISMGMDDQHGEL